MKKILILGTAPGWNLYPKDYDGEIWGLTKSLVVRANQGSPIRFLKLIIYFWKSQKTLNWLGIQAETARIHGRKKLWQWILFKKSKLKKEFELAPERIDRLFMMDQFKNLLSIYQMKVFTQGEYARQINKRDVQVVVSHKEPMVENCYEFPLKQVVEKLGGVIYFTNSICYMIALALYEGCEQIDLWGVAQLGIKEHMNERRGVEFWLGIACGIGVRVTINGISALLTHEGDILYGYKKTPKQIRTIWEEKL